MSEIQRQKISRSDVVIVGAGPSGLFAAEMLAQAGKKVHLYERKPAPARKFLLAGRGGLNLTHSEPLESFITRYRGREDFMAPLIRAFTPDDLRQWCEGLGQECYTGSSGRVFPKAMKASPLLRAWLARLEALGVQFHPQKSWMGWNRQGRLVFAGPDDHGAGEAVEAGAALLALGGASWPHLGADGSWTEILRGKGIATAPLRPANCGFTISWSAHLRVRFAGQPLKNIALSAGGETVRGEIMIDRNGIEGGAVYTLSAVMRESIDAHGAAKISIDLRPDMSREALRQKITRPRGRQSFSTFMQKTLNLSPLHIALLHEGAEKPTLLSPDALAQAIKAVRLTATSPFPIARAISSAGGIDTKALDANMMIRALPGVFAAGEMLDWEAPTGGYLLQGCFATGAAAARGILRWLERTGDA